MAYNNQPAGYPLQDPGTVRRRPEQEHASATNEEFRATPDHTLMTTTLSDP